MSQSSSTSESLPRRSLRRGSWALRSAWPDRQVTREVQGVRMTLPWSHRLPDYARVIPAYGQNLIHLAAELAGDAEPLTVLDVGANVGDSTLQILHVADARVLCVEADAYFLRYLHLNVDADDRVSVEPALLQAPSAEPAVQMAPVRVGGTTRFAEGESTETLPTISTAALRDKHPGFSSLRLAKSDTDGYDVELIPAIARTWADSPVLFFEYDHVLSRVAGNDPVAVWPELAALGYTEVAVWDNLGLPLGRIAVTDMPAASAPLDLPGEGRAHPYWDVAVVHADDTAAQAAIAKLVPTSF